MKINKYNNFRNISGSVLKELRLKNNLYQQDLTLKLQLLDVELTSKEIPKIKNDNRLVQDFELFAFAKVFNVSQQMYLIKNLINNFSRVCYYTTPPIFCNSTLDFHDINSLYKLKLIYSNCFQVI